MQLIRTTRTMTDKATATDRRVELRVLVVDDDKTIQAVLPRMLSELASDVVAVDSGAAALKLLEDQAFDVVLTDLDMPGMTGDELVRNIVARRDAQVPRLLVMTGGASQRLIDRALAWGAARVLRKPLEWGDLSAALLDHRD